MTTQSAATRSAASAAPMGTGIVTGAFDLLAVWNERRRQRRALMRLPDHLLSDIGVNRLEAGQEAEKPFWRG